MNEEEYYYNNEPLQLSYKKHLHPPEKIEIVYQLERDYEFWNGVGCSSSLDRKQCQVWQLHYYENN